VATTDRRNYDDAQPIGEACRAVAIAFRDSVWGENNSPEGFKRPVSANSRTILKSGPKYGLARQSVFCWLQMMAS